MSQLRALLARIAAWANTDADRGKGPLERCQSCRRARHDVVGDLCNPCSLRYW